MLRRWEELPDYMRIPEVRPYWEILDRKREELFLKRVFDFVAALSILVILALPMAVIAILIKLESEGPVFYRQDRVTAFGKRFRIHKFRTMVANADKIGAGLTVGSDPRITKVGAILRRLRFDEFPQVFDVLTGDMSLVGTRPEAVKYVEKYQPEFYATLLLPAGLTSEVSILYKDEEKLLNTADDLDKVYIEQILPAKMVLNLDYVRNFCYLGDILTLLRVVFVGVRILMEKKIK